MASWMGCSMVLITDYPRNLCLRLAVGAPTRSGVPHTHHIVSKAGLGGAAARGGVLPLARVSDGGGATRAAVCQRQPMGLGAEQVTRAPRNTKKISEVPCIYGTDNDELAQASYKSTEKRGVI